jgi:hypothetical protein
MPAYKGPFPPELPFLVPTIHDKGTPRDKLYSEALVLKHAYGTVLGMLADHQPDMRDYYPQGEFAYERALREHEQRVARTEELMGHYTRMAEALYQAPHQN